MVLRVGLVGCGAIARRAHLPAFRAAGADEVDVVAFASRSRSSAEAAAKEWGSGRVEDDWRRLVESPDVDAVDICSPNRFHAEVAVAAAGAGKHVLVEKPMACTVAEADAMITAAERSGVVLCVAHNLRFASPFFTARQVVTAGMLGHLVAFRAAFGHGGPQDWAPQAGWFFDPEQSGGGALIDLGIHVADLIRFVLDDDVTEVSALLSTRSPGVDEAAQVVLRMAGGAIGSFHASWVTHPAPDHQLTVFGTEATLHLDGRTPLTLLRPDAEAEPVALEKPGTGLYAGFVRACLGPEPSPVSAEDGRAALAVVEAAYRSAASGQVTAPAGPVERPR
jgi:UDP-N-acetylglucosamine 3-dehydrogenase